MSDTTWYDEQIPTEEEIENDDYSTAQVANMRRTIDMVNQEWRALANDLQAAQSDCKRVGAALKKSIRLCAAGRGGEG